jgi:hypothetical protein
MDPLQEYKKVQEENLKRSVRLSVQYSIAATLFTGAAILLNEVLISLAVLGILLLSFYIRILQIKKVNKITLGLLKDAATLSK